MALNQSHWNNGVLIHNGEWILLYCDGVEIGFDGADEAAMKSKKKGRLYLTSHRVIFISKEPKDALQSFAIPFTSLGSVDIDQPVFGANAIKGKVKALPNGGWAGIAQFRISFSHGGAIEFGQAMLQAAKLASRNPPPPYTPAYTPQTDGAKFYNPPPQYYTPQTQNMDGFIPPKDKFPSAPPAQEVYMTDAPPPYSSIYSQPQYPATAAGFANTAPQIQHDYPVGAPPPGYPAGSTQPAGYAGQNMAYPSAPPGYPTHPQYPPAPAGYPVQQPYGAAAGMYPNLPAGAMNYSGPPPPYAGKQ